MSRAPGGDCKSAAFDHEELLQRCMGNEDLLRNLLERFLERIEAEMGEAPALLEKDTRDLAALAHRLKGLAANLAAHPLHDCAARLERLALERDREPILGCLEELAAEVEKFKEAATSALRSVDTIPAA